MCACVHVPICFCLPSKTLPGSSSPWKVKLVISCETLHCFVSHNSEGLCKIIAVGIHLRLSKLCNSIEHNDFSAICISSVLLQLSENEWNEKWKIRLCNHVKVIIIKYVQKLNTHSTVLSNDLYKVIVKIDIFDHFSRLYLIYNSLTYFKSLNSSIVHTMLDAVSFLSVSDFIRVFLCWSCNTGSCWFSLESSHQGVMYTRWIQGKFK